MVEFKKRQFPIDVELRRVQIGIVHGGKFAGLQATVQ
jgi:hypothetical protein